MSKHFHQIQDVFSNRENAAGIWAVKLYLRGKPYKITVDELFWTEYDIYQANLKYAPIYRDHFWVPILEKAYAKLMGNYLHLENQHPANALSALTGAPVFTTAVTTGQAAYDSIKAAL